MFPFDIDDTNIIVNINKEDEPADYEVIFTNKQTSVDEQGVIHVKETSEMTGILSGKIIRGLEALKQWIYICLMIERYKYIQYSWQYGNELMTLIGSSYGVEVIEAEAKRYIEEALLINPFITGIEDFICEVKGSTITCSFTVITTYGNTEAEVEF